MVTCSTDISIGFWWQLVPWTSTWSWAAVWTTDINMGTAHAKNKNFHLSSSDKTNYEKKTIYEHQHGLRQHHRPQTPKWPVLAKGTMDIITSSSSRTIDINIASGNSTDHRHHHGPGSRLGQGHQHGAAWITDINLGFGGSTDHDDQLGLKQQHKY